MSMAQLREQIQARKFSRNEIDVQVSNLAKEIRDMVGTKLTPNRQIPFDAIANRAIAASGLMQTRTRLQNEIDQAERELSE